MPTNLPSATSGVLVWQVPGFSGEVPGWFADFLRWIVQRKINSEGELQAMEPEEWKRLRDQLQTAAQADLSEESQRQLGGLLKSLAFRRTQLIEGTVPEGGFGSPLEADSIIQALQGLAKEHEAKAKEILRMAPAPA